MNQETEPRNGQIRLVSFDSGSALQGGVRPAVIVQNNVGCAKSPRIWVIPLTTRHKSMHLATHIAVPATLGNGLHRSSVALVEQARFVLREDISRYIGLLEDSVRYQLGEAWILNCDMFAPQIKVLTRRIA